MPQKSVSSRRKKRGGALMKTAFNVGECVESLVTDQGLVKGHKYTVEKVFRANTPFGLFVTYRVSRDLKELDVANGHLVLWRVRQ